MSGKKLSRRLLLVNEAATSEDRRAFVAADWTPEADAILGTDTDWNIARRLGCYGENVGARRKVLGIPGFRPAVRPWTADEEKTLGTDTIANLAIRLDRPINQIAKRMKELGISPLYLPTRSSNKSPAARHRAELKARAKANAEQRWQDRQRLCVMLSDGWKIKDAAQHLGIAVETARKRTEQFLRALRHPERLGRSAVGEVIRNMRWQDVQSDCPAFFKEALRCMEVEHETDSLDVWAERFPRLQDERDALSQIDGAEIDALDLSMKATLSLRVHGLDTIAAIRALGYEGLALTIMSRIRAGEIWSAIERKEKGGR